MSTPRTDHTAAGRCERVVPHKAESELNLIVMNKLNTKRTMADHLSDKVLLNKNYNCFIKRLTLKSPSLAVLHS